MPKVYPQVYLDAQNRLHHELLEGRCPHCGVIAHRTVLAYPSFERLLALKPAMIGVVLQCDACRTPLFRRYPIAGWRPGRIDIQPAGDDLERATEHFPHKFLPERVGQNFREALSCYSAGLLQAFTVMCRLTMQAMVEDLGEKSRLKIFDQITELGSLAGLDEESFAIVRRTLLDSAYPATAREQEATRQQAALLLETLKDLLQQNYVRRERLRESLRSHGVLAKAKRPEVLPAPAGSPAGGDPRTVIRRA